MRCKSFLLLLLLCSLSQLGQAQVSLQELVNKKQFEAVIARVDSLTPADSSDYTVMSAIGQAYEGVLKYKDAYRFYQHCLDMDTMNIDALNALARAALSFGKTAKAEQCYLKVLETDSMNFYANHQLGRLYYQLGDYGKAIERYHTLTEIDNENPTIISGLADCHMKKGGLNVLIAIELYSWAFQLNPENARLGSTFINTLLHASQPQVALPVCDTALYYNPKNKELRQNKGMALYLLKKYQAVDSIYSELLAEGDSSFITLKYTGASRFMSGHAMDAIEPLQFAYEMDSTDVETTILLGASLGKTYDRKRAYQLFDQADKNMAPKAFLVNLLLNYRGETLWRDGRYDEAIALYYGAWKEDESRLDLLSKISSRYNLWGNFSMEEKDSQRCLFIRYLYLTECLKNEKEKASYFSFRPYLETTIQEAFFQSATELPTLAPDGRKGKVSVEDLRTLLSQLPEMTEREQVIYNDMMKITRKNQSKVNSSSKENKENRKAEIATTRKAVEKKP